MVLRQGHWQTSTHWPKHDLGKLGLDRVSGGVQLGARPILWHQQRMPAEHIGINVIYPWPVPNMEVKLHERQHPAGVLARGGWLVE
jgi:hypothetical protein